MADRANTIASVAGASVRIYSVISGTVYQLGNLPLDILALGKLRLILIDPKLPFGDIPENHAENYRACLL
jgi:hypothetical protein